MSYIVSIIDPNPPGNIAPGSMEVTVFATGDTPPKSAILTSFVPNGATSTLNPMPHPSTNVFKGFIAAHDQPYRLKAEVNFGTRGGRSDIVVTTELGDYVPGRIGGVAATP